MNRCLSNEKNTFADNSRDEPTIFFMEKQLLSLKLLSGDFYGQSFIKTVRGPFAHVVARISTKRSYAGKIKRFHALLIEAFEFRNTLPNDFCYVSTCENRQFIQNMLEITFSLYLNLSFVFHQCKIYFITFSLMFSL